MQPGQPGQPGQPFQPRQPGAPNSPTSPTRSDGHGEQSLQPVQFGPPPQPYPQRYPQQPGQPGAYPPQQPPFGPPPTAPAQYDQGLHPVQFGPPPAPARPRWPGPYAPPAVPAQLAPHPQAAARGYLPIFVFLAYLAFLMTGFGFGQHLGPKIGDIQALPIYTFFCLLLLTLQEAIAAHRSHGRFAYVFVASAFAIVYAADAVFHPFLRDRFTISPYTYIVLNAVIVLIYLWDVLSRRMRHPQGLRGSLASYSLLAADFAGLAVVFFVAAILLDCIGPQTIFGFFGFHVGQPLVSVDLDKTLGLHWKPPLDTLEGLNYVAGLIAIAITLLLFVIVGVLLPSGPQDMAAPRLSLNATLRAVWREVREQVSTSLSLVLGPFVWLLPAFSIAYFSVMIKDYLNRSAASTGTILDLFNPFSATSVDSYGQGIEALLLGIFALATVVLAVAITERDREVVSYTLSIFGATARVVLVIWVFFIYSLAVINAIVILLGVTQVRPFQVGAPGLISLIFALLFFWRESLRRAPRVPAAPSSAPANAPVQGRR